MVSYSHIKRLKLFEDYFELQFVLIEVGFEDITECVSIIFVLTSCIDESQKPIMARGATLNKAYTNNCTFNETIVFSLR